MMMKKLIVLGFLMIGATACRRSNEVNTADTAAGQTLTIAQVKTWFDQKATNQLRLSNDTARFQLTKLQLNWSQASTFPSKGNNGWVIALKGSPVYRNFKTGYRKLAFIRDSTGQIQARILEIIPDGLYWQRKGQITAQDFTGHVFIYDENYHLTGGQVIAGGKVCGEIKAGRVNTAPAKRLTTNADVIEDCTWMDSNYIDAEGVFTVYSQKICAYSVVPGEQAPFTTVTDPGSGGGDASAASAPALSNLPEQSGPGINAQAYMQCFGNIPDAGAKMQVTIYVQQPWPGTQFNIGPNSVGHTAIGLSKSGSGNTVTQVVGFYPTEIGLSVQSKIVDNGGAMDYNNSITYTVTAQQFKAITDFVSNPPPTYDLVNYNCTSFVYYACRAGDIYPPNPYAYVGMDPVVQPVKAMAPGGIAESINDMKGQSGVNTSGGIAPLSKGPCN